MRILLAHNFYQSSAPSGEDVVYRNERAMLETAGYDIVPFERYNDDISAATPARIGTALESLWSPRSYKDMRELIRGTRPDVAHFHNTFPLITPSAYKACHDEGIPVVQTLHNYRLLCPGGLFMRNNRPCEECLDISLTRSIRHACYRGSHVATAVVAGGLQLNRSLGSYSRYVDQYIALTQFAKERFVRSGLSPDQIVVRPNGLAHTPPIGSGNGGYALYVGRLTQEKGAETLLRAWSSIDQIPLRIAGDGALRKELQLRYGKSNIDFLGFLPHADIWSLMQKATMLVIPSQCYEGFPLTVLEAYASGTPVVASAIGALDEIVSDPANGRKFAMGNPESLRSAVCSLLADRTELLAIRRRNRLLFDQCYSAASSLASLQTIYARAGGTDRSSRAVC